MTLLQKGWLKLKTKKMHRFFCIPHAEKWLLIKAFILVSGIVLALQIFPFRISYRFTSKVPAKQVDYRFSEKQIIRAIEMSSYYMPCSTCLSKAMAGHVLLAKYGYGSNFRIGVARDNGRLLAHAWLENQGRILVGDIVKNYVPLPMEEIRL
jgi:hypothetical protein